MATRAHCRPTHTSRRSNNNMGSAYKRLDFITIDPHTQQPGKDRELQLATIRSHAGSVRTSRLPRKTRSRLSGLNKSSGESRFRQTRGEWRHFRQGPSHCPASSPSPKGTRLVQHPGKGGFTQLRFPCLGFRLVWRSPLDHLYHLTLDRDSHRDTVQASWHLHAQDLRNQDSERLGIRRDHFDTGSPGVTRRTL